MLSIVVHIAFGIAGLCCLYLGLALTEDEEGKLQNRLEEFWIRVSDLQSAAISVQVAFLKQLAILLGAALDKIFGTPLFSQKSVIASIWFSLASTLLYTGIT